MALRRLARLFSVRQHCRGIVADAHQVQHTLCLIQPFAIPPIDMHVLLPRSTFSSRRASCGQRSARWTS